MATTDRADPWSVRSPLAGNAEAGGPSVARRVVWHRLRRQAKTLFGAAVLLAATLLAIVAPSITPFDPDKSSLNARLLPPFSSLGGVGHFLGTD
jgi:ABC-type antimicrobial peptide transport system permease subunit